MRRKLQLTVLGAAIATGAALRGVDAPLQGSLSIAAISAYVYRGQQLGGATLQSTVDAQSGSLDFGLTTSVPKRRDGNDEPGTEFDLYGSHTTDLADGFAVIPGFTVYSFPNAPAHAGQYRTRFEPYLALSYTLAGVRFVPACYYDFSRRGPTYELSAAIAFPLTKLGSELDLTASVGGYVFRDAYNKAEPRAKLSGAYCSAAATVPFQLTVASKLSLGVTYGATLHNSASTTAGLDVLATHRLTAQVSYTYTF